MGFNPTTTYALTCDVCGTELASGLPVQDLPDGAAMLMLGSAPSGVPEVILGPCCMGRAVGDIVAWLQDSAPREGRRDGLDELADALAQFAPVPASRDHDHR